MKLKRWPTDIAAMTGAGAGALIAILSAPEPASATITNAWCAGVVLLCVAFAVGATTIRNRYLR